MTAILEVVKPRGLKIQSRKGSRVRIALAVFDAVERQDVVVLTQTCDSGSGQTHWIQGVAPSAGSTFFESLKQRFS